MRWLAHLSGSLSGRSLGYSYLPVLTKSDRPIITIFAQASGSNGGAVGMAIVIIMVVWFSAVEVVTASARLNRAFATHGGLPFSA